MGSMMMGSMLLALQLAPLSASLVVDGQLLAISGLYLVELDNGQLCCYPLLGLQAAFPHSPSCSLR